MFVPVDPEEIVTPKDLVKCAKQIATKWKNIGYELGLEPQDIDIIAADNPTSCEEACKSMLFKWYRKNAQPTFGMLDRAIKSCKNISGTYAATNWAWCSMYVLYDTEWFCE